MNLQDQIYDLFINAGCDRNENQNKVIHDKYIIKRGHSPNGWYSLSNKDRFRLQMTPVGVKWEYVQVNNTMFLWYDGDVLKKLIAYVDYPDGTTRAYYEGDVHITSIIRRRIPPTVLTRKYCKICGDNLLGREIRGFLVDLGEEKGGGNGYMDLHLYEKSLCFRSDIPARVDGIWPFNKWLHKYLRWHRELPLEHFEKSKTDGLLPRP